MVFNNCKAVPLGTVVEVTVETTDDAVDVTVVLVSATASPLAGTSSVELTELDTADASLSIGANDVELTESGTADAQPTANTNESVGNINATVR